MNNFTFKDFISYNNPCFICNKLTLLAINFNGKSIYPFLEKDNNKQQILRWTLHGGCITFNIKSNKYETIYYKKIDSFIKNTDIYISIECKNCGCRVISNSLKFNYDKSYVEPLSIHSEFYYLSDSKNKYTVLLLENRISVSLSEKDGGSTFITLPKFKRPNNKELLLKK